MGERITARGWPVDPAASWSGYLTTAGRAIPVGTARATVLAGWDPDQTYWLRDATRNPSKREHWTCENDKWVRV